MSLLESPTVVDRESTHLAHQYDTSEQQQDASKLGMWIFLTTEIMLFSGLMCAYAVFKMTKPDIFAWGHHILDIPLGAINTIVLITSSFTMAWAVRAVQLDQRRLAIVLMISTIVCGLGFLGIKAIEYTDKIHYGLVPGAAFKPNMRYVATRFGVSRAQLRKMVQPPTIETVIPLFPADATRGKIAFDSTCYSCHGLNGAGLTNLGANLRTSKFVAGKTDEALLAFIKSGRLPTDPETVLKLTMPPKGGNPSLNDRNLADAVAYIRTLQKDEKEHPGAAEQVAVGVLPKSFIAPAAVGPEGFAQPALRHPPTSLDEFNPPHNEQLFFSIYFLLTGLHGIHVIIGLGIITWLLIGTWRGSISSNYSTPVDLGGLYWHLVDIIWIFLFPLIYLLK